MKKTITQIMIYSVIALVISFFTRGFIELFIGNLTYGITHVLSISIVSLFLIITFGVLILEKLNQK